MILLLSLLAACAPAPEYQLPQSPGCPGPLPSTTVVDEFGQGEGRAAVDVLWVVDNSPGSSAAQNAVALAAPAFFGTLLTAEVDFHVGVVSTDMVHLDHAGALRAAGGLRWLEPETPLLEDLFVQMAMLGETGDPAPMGRDAVSAALLDLADTTNAGFQRDGVPLEVVFVSNDADHSESNYAEFESWLLGDEARVWSIVCAEEGADCAADQVGADYVALAAASDGSVFDVADPDLGDELRNVATRSAELFGEFHLLDIPDVDTVDVWTHEAAGQVYAFAMDDDYVYEPEPNSVSFVHYLPGPGAAVYVEYRPARR